MATFFLCAIPAFCDVIDVAPGGVLTFYKSPAIFNDSGVRQILPGRMAHPRNTFTSYSTPGPVESMLSFAATRYSIDAPLLRGLAWQESRFHHDAVSPKGAVGVMQLMPGTARDLGVDRYDLSQNILGGAAYLRQMLDRYRGNQSLALAAYNAGPNAVDHYLGIPPFLETNTYVNSIMNRQNPAVVPLSPFVIFVNH